MPVVYAASVSPITAPAETAAKTTALNVLLDFVLPFARLSSETATHVCVIVFQITLYMIHIFYPILKKMKSQPHQIIRDKFGVFNIKGKIESI